MMFGESRYILCNVLSYIDTFFQCHVCCIISQIQYKYISLIDQAHHNDNLVVLPYPRGLMPRVFKLGKSWSGGWAFTWEGLFNSLSYIVFVTKRMQLQSTIIHIYPKLLIGWLLHETTEFR